jgi:wyosine [tRNA(Phe)-imidazoG37] synthetase (radical SAM superfamily)
MYTRHERKWLQNRYVYPVISRRSGGLSIGINLNPDKICNFGCVYCQVQRSEDEARPAPVDVALVQAELKDLLQQAVSGSLWEDAFFADVPVEKRVLRDVAFSGDAEPTSSPSFLEVVRMVAKLTSRMQLRDVKLVLITNATLLTRDLVAAGLQIMDEHNGEIWAKLDAGTAAYYKLVNQAVIPFERILDNILQTGQKRTIVIQTMVASIGGEPFPITEQDAYIQQLATLLQKGCRIQRLQLYTVARQPGEANLPEHCDVKAVPHEHLELFQLRIHKHLPQLQIDLF